MRVDPAKGGNPLRCAVYIERCLDCGHTQASHIAAKGGILMGHMVPCRFDTCHCPRWASSWTPGFVLG